MASLQDRIVLAASKRGLSQADICRKTNIKSASVSNWFTGKTKALKGDTLVRVSDLLRVPPRWLAGDDLREPDWEAEGSNVAPGPRVSGTVPLISSVKAGAMTEAVDIHAPGFADDWIETTAPIGPHTYALRVRGDSMEPLFPEGHVVIVEPDLDANPGDFVIAKNGEGEATLKQLVRDGVDLFLKPLNERYPIKPLGSSVIIGVVRQVTRTFR